MGPNEVLDKGYIAGDEIPLFHIVKQNGVETAELNDGAGDDWLGVAQEEANEEDAEYGRVIRVRLMGISRIVAAEAITERDRVASDDGGKAVVATDGDHVVGIALTEAAEDGDWINVLLTPGVEIPSGGGT